MKFELPTISDQKHQLQNTRTALILVGGVVALSLDVIAWFNKGLGLKTLILNQYPPPEDWHRTWKWSRYPKMLARGLFSSILIFRGLYTLRGQTRGPWCPKDTSNILRVNSGGKSNVLSSQIPKNKALHLERCQKCIKIRYHKAASLPWSWLQGVVRQLCGRSSLNSFAVAWEEGLKGMKHLPN